MKKYLIEFLGTFFLVLVVAFTGNPLAIGAVLAAIVYMGGYISGAHYNPAVTLGLLLSKKINLDISLRYMLTQLLASIIASAVYFYIHGAVFLPEIGHNVSFVQAVIIETLFTF